MLFQRALESRHDKAVTMGCFGCLNTPKFQRKIRHTKTNYTSFTFYSFYKLGNAPKSVSAGAARTPLGKLTALPQTLAGGEGARRVLPKNPTPYSALRALAIQAMLCRPQH